MSRTAAFNFISSFPLPRSSAVQRRALFPILKMSAKPQTIVITGATRGIGRGLAIGAAEAGMHVIITGRTKSGPFSLQTTADLIKKAGATCEYYIVDHSNDESISSFFEDLTRTLQIQKRSLDVFVNNAYAGVDFIKQSMNIPFWLKSASEPDKEDPNSCPGQIWDLVNGVGLRSNYVCAIYATRIMNQQTTSAVIVNISSWAGLSSVFDPVYCVGKSAMDRLSAEIGTLTPANVCCFTLWPGFVGTERLLDAIHENESVATKLNPSNIITFSALPEWNMESPVFVGRVVAAIAKSNDTQFLDAINSRIVIAAEAARKLNVCDENGFRPLSYRSVRFALLAQIPLLRNSALRHLIPAGLVSPWWLTRAIAGTPKFWN